MHRFKVGQIFTWTCWVTGGTMSYQIIDRTENKIYTQCTDEEIDGIHDRTEEFDIIAEENGNEKIQMCEYHGEVGYVYAADLSK